MSLIQHTAGGGSAVLGFGAALPDRILTADDLGAPFGKDGRWVTDRTGIAELRRADSSAEFAGLVAVAARRALAQSGRDEADVDMVITTSCSVVSTPDQPAGLGDEIAPRAGRLHINSACSGFCYALSTADSLVRTGAARLVLVVAAERMSDLLDPDDFGTSIVFGDGVGAAVVAADPDGACGVGSVVWGSDGSQSQLIACDASPAGRLRMVGSAVFRWATELVPKLAVEACARAGVRLEDIDVFVPHQANQRIIDAVINRLGLKKAMVADSVRRVGNTSAASIPIALAELQAHGALEAGSLALLVGFGAGLSYAGQVIRLP